MKRSIQVMTATVFVFIATIASPVKAQGNEKEIAKLVKAYEDAYNKEDAKAIKKFYTKDAVRVNPDGTTTNGSEEIVATIVAVFGNSDVKIKITADKSVTESDGTITSTGSYEGTVEGGDPFSGNYTNTLVKKNGRLKISKSVLTN